MIVKVSSNLFPLWPWAETNLDDRTALGRGSRFCRLEHSGDADAAWQSGRSGLIQESRRTYASELRHLWWISACRARAEDVWLFRLRDPSRTSPSRRFRRMMNAMNISKIKLHGVKILHGILTPKVLAGLYKILLPSRCTREKKDLHLLQACLYACMHPECMYVCSYIVWCSIAK